MSQRNRTIRRLAVVAVLCCIPFAAFAGGDRTGQGIMVNLRAEGTFALSQNQLYKFDGDAAKAYFTNGWDGVVPVPTCSGSATNCASTNKPATPAAPAALDYKLWRSPGSGVVADNRCTFLDGGSLTGGSYTQSLTINGLNGRGNWSYTYNYVIAPAVQYVDPFTAWPLVKVNGQTVANIPVQAEIAGESVVQSNNAKVGTKYSFSLYGSPDPITGIAPSRVANLQVAVNDGTSTTTFSPGSTIRYPADFAYATNAGSNGVTGLLQNGDARTILNTDSFAGNNNGGSDGSALALATMDPVMLSLGAGEYNVTLTGTVKDNSATASIAFSITQHLTIVTPGCSH